MSKNAWPTLQIATSTEQAPIRPKHCPKGNLDSHRCLWVFQCKKIYPKQMKSHKATSLHRKDEWVGVAV